MLFASASGKRPMRTRAAAVDNTPPVFDQKYRGMVDLITKKRSNGLSSIDVAR
jgi:hypothetical protein